jgi:S1-C subfamily serine protease
MNKSRFAAMLAAGAALALSPAHVAAQAAAKPVSLGIKFDHMAGGGTDGPEVTEILPGRNGAAVGFKVGDILIEAGGKPISAEVLREYMKNKKVGDQLTFKVKRAGAVLDLSGTVMEAPEGAPPTNLQPAG